jgi:hypothetical protein
LGAFGGAEIGIAVECGLGFKVPSMIVAVTVLIAWVVLAISRQWQAERSWIDRIGRLIGVLWLATIPVYVTGFVIAYR